MKKQILLCSLVIIAIGNSAYAINDKNCEKKLFGKCQEVKPPVKEQEMTLGVVQRDIKIGSSQDEVAIALGSPNIVTKDSDGKDTWIYDKISRITSYNATGFSAGIILVNYGKAKSNVQSEQKTLTVVIKYDKNNKVESFTYHMSKF